MTKPHILTITPYLPYPPNSGGRSRTYNLIRHLRDDYRLSLICFGRPEEQAFDLSPLRELCTVQIVDRAPSPGTIKAAVMSLTSPKPVTMRIYHTPAMARAIADFLSLHSVDLIHVESFYMMPNLPRDLDMPVLLSEPAIEHIAWGRHAKVAKPFYTRPAILLEAMKMSTWEPRMWSEATVVGAMSEIDAEIIKRAVPGIKTILAPNGVDVDYFKLNEAVRRDNRTGIFMGDYKYFPNTDAVRYFNNAIMPLVHKQRGDFQLMLLGKDAPRDLLALHNDPTTAITVAGFVEDTRPYLHDSALFVCPLRSGSGTRFKLMEALACGMPVVSTSVGAEGLDAVDGEHMLIRDDPQGFADAIVHILDNPIEAGEMARRGRNWVVSHHAWAHSAALLRDAYDKLIGHEFPTLNLDKDQAHRIVSQVRDALDDVEEHD
ncbi:MAG: glycosyltransferase [Anaerolineae bacterium]|nr:glycosyltransferase [Anaerolineae bacterium]